MVNTQIYVKHEVKTKSLTLTKFFFLIYLFSIPFLMPTFLKAAIPLNLYGVSLSLVTMIPSFVLFVISDLKSNKPFNRLRLSTFVIVILLGGYSTMMGALNYSRLGTLYGQNSISSTISFLIYPIYAWLAIYVNYHGFRLLTKRTLKRFFNFSSCFFIIVSIFQILVIYGPTWMANFYDNLNFRGLFRSSYYLLDEGKVCGFTIEPSNISMFVCSLLIPYNFLVYAREHKRFNIITGCLLILCSAMSLGTTVYFSLIVLLLIFIVLVFRTKQIHVTSNMVFAFVLFMITGTILVTTNFGTVQSIINKASDLNNMSTSYRCSIVYNDWIIFTNNFFGIGNGNQGFFYNDVGYLFLNSGSLEVQAALSGKAGLVGGGPFWGSVISGYGVVGIAAVAYIAYKFIKQNKYQTNSLLRNLFICYILVFAVSAFVSENINLNMFFTLGFSLPLCRLKDDQFVENHVVRGGNL